MAVQELKTLPAPFVEELGKELATQIRLKAQIPVVAPGIAGISQLAGESAADFAKRQQAAQQFDIRQQSLAGLAPQVAGQVNYKRSTNSSASWYRFFSPFLQTAQTQAGLAQGILGQAGQLTGAGTTLGATPLGAHSISTRCWTIYVTISITSY